MPLIFKEEKSEKRKIGPAFIADSDIAKIIGDVLSIDKLMLLGSGQISFPKSEWIKSIPTIRANDRTLNFLPYRENRIVGIVSSLLSYKKIIKLIKKNCYCDPLYLFVNHHNSSFSYKKEVLIENKEIIIYHFGSKKRKNVSYIGEWIVNQNFKHRFSTGFWMIYWLLNGKQKETYIAGFDAMKNSKKRLYIGGFSQKIKPDGSSPHHNFILEWEIWEKAIKIARKRGMKVYLSK